MDDVILDLDMLNKMLVFAYETGRENENREERGIPLLDPQEEFIKYLTTLKNSV